MRYGERQSGKRILVAGIGNIFLGDDAFGCEVVKQLLMHQLPPEVHIEDFGIRSLDLAFALLDNYDATILVDTVCRKSTPGTLYTIEPDLHELEEMAAASPLIETHGMDPAKVLALVKSMGGNFGRILLVGCEPQEIEADEDGRVGLSEPVSAAVSIAATVVESLIKQILNDTSWQVKDESRLFAVEVEAAKANIVGKG